MINLFGPMIYAIVTIHHVQHDMQLIAEADKAITEMVTKKGPGAREASIRLATKLELQTILCTKYRYIQ